MVYLDDKSIQQLIEAFNQRNLEPALKLFSEGVILHCPGKNRVSGDYHGRSGVVEFWKKQIALTNNTLQGQVIATSQGEGILVLIMDVSVELDDQQVSWQRVNQYHVVDARIIECWIYEGDQYTADAVFA